MIGYMLVFDENLKLDFEKILSKVNLCSADMMPILHIMI